MAKQYQARATLEAIVSDGITIDLYSAHEASSLNLFIGERAEAINEASFGAFFGSIQLILGRYQALSIARMFESASTRFTLRSIPSALAILKEHGHLIPIKQRPGLERELQRLGADAETISKLQDGELTEFVAEFFEERLRNLKVGDRTSLEIVEDLKTVRDKLVVHHEHVDVAAMKRPTYAEFDALLQYAREFVAVVGFGYFSIAYTDDNGTYGLDVDATRSTRCLGRILKSLGISDHDA
jgi:hypothetical protein